MPLGRVIHEIKSGWVPPSLHVDLLRAQGCEPRIYTMADIDRLAALSEFKAWLVAHELAIPILHHPGIQEGLVCPSANYLRRLDAFPGVRPVTDVLEGRELHTG
jgi:hypothetical protein